MLHIPNAGPNLVVSLFNDANPMSFANAVVDYELAFPCRGADRHTTWLFTPNGSSRWTGAAIDATLADVKGSEAHALAAPAEWPEIENFRGFSMILSLVSKA